VSELRPGDVLDLLDWRRRVFALYQQIPAASRPESAWIRWRGVRDGLFRSHPQSPVPEERRADFPALSYFDYDPAARVLGTLESLPAEHLEVAGSAGAIFGSTLFARVSFELRGESLSLGAYWLDGYAGGLFLPFRDATSGTETYGAGRYLLDTAKGADLGVQGDRLILDFNFAYNPSCAYDPRWACPLAPPENRLSVPIRAGERYPDSMRPPAIADVPSATMETSRADLPE
jgi:uncharacterized protein (DUF1684 family)